MASRILDPHTRKFLDALAASGRPGYHQLTPAQARESQKTATSLVTPSPPSVGEVRDLALPAPDGGTIRVRLYQPMGTLAESLLPGLVYLHGGGWTIGDLDTHDTLCRELAQGAQCVVISVDYRLAPEHPFPAAVEDCWNALVHIAENSDRFGIDRTRLAVGGDSAGGNLAAVMALKARDHGGPTLAFQLLIYPATDQTLEMPSHFENGKGYLLTREVILYFRNNYLRPDQHLDWRASPLMAKDFSGLPPAMVMTAGFDPLLDEGVAYADRLSKDGVQVQTVCYDDMIHGFIRMGKVIPRANEAVQDCVRALRRAFGTSA